MTVQTVFRHVNASDALESAIRARAEQLEPLDHILGCRVVVDRPHRQHRQGNAIQVRVELSRRGEDIVASVEGQAGVETAIDNAFDIARRRLEDLTDSHRTRTRHHTLT